MDFSSPFYTPAAASESVGESLEISSSSSAPSGLVAGQPSHEPAREEEPEPSASASTSASATTAYDQYAEMFPSLPTAAPASKPAAKSRASQGRASQASNSAKPREHTERFQIDPAQLRPSGLGDKAHTEIIRNIANDTGTKIEFSTSKNGTMTVIISGKVSEKISAAKKRVLSSLSKQYEAKIEVSREYLSAFIGKAGANLKQLQEKTGARINVPKADEQSELVTVTGDKAAVEEARKLITEFVKEKSNFVRESINIDEAFQPFVFGAGNETLKTIAQETGTKIFPPANYGESTGETEVSISGPREGVSEALKRIQTLYVEKKRSTKEVKVSVNKKQHRFVIGQKGVNINEILAKTGCTVKIPPLDDPSDSITITGDEKNLIQAVSLVFEKSNSVHLEEIQIDGEHMQRYVSQKARPAIKELEKSSKATINLAPKMIDIQGPKEDVENVRSKIINMLAGFKSLKFEEIEVAPELRKFVTGKKGQNIQKIKTEHGVDVLVPSDDEDKLPVLIAGEKSKLKAVKEQLLKPIKEVLSLPVLEFKVDPKFLWVITGAKGETIKKLSDEYESCSIRVPRADEKSDVVALRGPKEDVEKLKKHILQLVEDTRQYEITHNYKEEITVERKIVKFIVGKGGVIINRLREVHDVKIEIEESAKEEKETKEAKEAKGKDKEAAKGKDKKEQAKEGDKEKEQAKEGEKGRPRGRGPEPMDKITIKGVKKNVEAAKEALLAKVKEISEGGDYVTIELKIDQKYHGSLIGSQGKFVKSLMDRHSIQVRFPREPPLDIVSISGLQKSVEKAKEELLELLEYEKSISHTQTVAGNNAVLKQVMGLKNMTKQRVLNIMDQTRTHIDFEGGDKEGSKLLIRGTAKGVEEAKALLTKYIEDVANSVSEEMEIDPSLHKVVIGLKGSKVREISEKHGNVDIRFPQDKTSKIVVLTGAPKDVEGAKKEITQYLSTVDAGPQSNRTVEIPQRYHGGLISYIRNNPAIKARVMFPRGGDEPDLVQVRGKDADIEEALKLMNENLEESVVVTVPTRLHRALLMGGKIKDFNVKNHVVVKFPERESPSQEVVIRGRQAVLSDAEKAFKELVAQTEKAEEARAASGAGRDRERGEGSSKDSDRKKTSIPFKPDYIGRIIGKKGANFRHISDVANVSLDVDKAKNVIHITGSAQGVELAKKELSEIIHEIESQSSEVLKVDYRFHSRLAGEGFSNINQIQDVFSVRIKLEKDREQIIVTGKAEDVKAALKYIKDSIEEMKAEHQLEHKDKPRDRDRGSRQGSSSSSSSSASSSSSSSGKGRAVPMNDPFFAPPPQQQQQPAPDKTSVWGTKMA